MARTDAFTPRVAARTRAAQMILETPELLAAYEDAGGIREDLEEILQQGLQAEAANTGQSLATGEARGITAEALVIFERTRAEYLRVMAVVQAVRYDLVRDGWDKHTIKAIDQILKNEVPVRIVAVEKEGTTTRTARKARSFEAIRSEILKDANALLSLQAVLPALARRRVTEDRLRELAHSADGLSGQFGEKTVKRGAAKAATQVEREAVNAQKQAWQGTYRILSIVGRQEPRIAQLLSEAARAR